MTTATQPNGNGSKADVLVGQKTDHGIVVHSPSNPAVTYLVTGTKERPHCTCGAFQALKHQPQFRCDHIKAVEAQLPLEADQQAEPFNADDYQDEPGNAQEVPPPNTPPMLTLKRSISPDGRIDSLSVEIAYPLASKNSEAILTDAKHVLSLQNAIADDFRRENPVPQRTNGHQNGNGQHSNGNSYNNHHPNGNGHNGNGAQYSAPDASVPAHLLDVGGMNTRYGFKHFITVQVSDQRLKLFGAKAKLGEHIAAAGYPERGQYLENGTRLDLPCRVVLQQAGGNKYPTITQVLPAHGNGAHR